MISVKEKAEAHCLGCGYSLRGLGGGRCPECGQPFDLDNPWMVWLPHRPNHLAQWLIRPPTRFGKAIPVIAILLAAWGSRIPTWNHPAMSLSVILLVSCAIAMAAWRVAIAYVRRRGYHASRLSGDVPRWRRTVVRAAIVVALLILLRPTMFLCFWISRPWLEPIAKQVLTEHFSYSPARGVEGLRGAYFVRHIRRCPHGVKLHVTETSWSDDTGPGFFYRETPGDCERFDLLIPLGGGWYVSR